MAKPHRVVLDRVSGYADEAAAFMRRRRLVRRPFARVYRADGSAVDHPPDTETGAALVSAASRMIELAGEGSRRSDRPR
jgi:hypothetical protein